MPCIDNFSQWNKLDIKNQIANPIGIKCPIVNCRIRKKKTTKIFIYFINRRLNVTLATK